MSSGSWGGSSAPYIYTVTVNGITANSDIQIVPDPSITSSAASAFMGAGIITGSQTTNSITLKAFYVKPTVNIPIVIMVGDEVV